MRIAVLDEQAVPIEPYTLENCVPLTTDSVRHRIQWRGATKLAPADGKTVRLRFEWTRGELYAFWTGEERAWNSPDTTTW